MTAPAHPQLYLVTPPVIDLDLFPDLLAAVLDAQAVACIRLGLATQDQDRIARAADACRAVAHARDVALVVNDHSGLAERLGLDGVHLSDATKSVRAARKALGPDAIVGAFCGTSRHDGITAGEAGADYVAFGPLRAVADEAVAEIDMFRWWTEMIEVPVVAEGGLTPALIAELAEATDFLAIGEEIWASEEPVQTLAGLMAALR